VSGAVCPACGVACALELWPAHGPCSGAVSCIYGDDERGTFTIHACDAHREELVSILRQEPAL
jgi:Zn ribbon nucleic-acid-binding protein